MGQVDGQRRRTYQATHPWLTFAFTLTGARPRFWMLLADVQAKCSHLKGVPLQPAVQQALHQLYLAKGALATTAIEGNTLSEDEVRQHLEGDLDVPPSRKYLTQEIDNIVRACNDIGARVAEGRTEITSDLLLEFNRRVLKDLPVLEHVSPGEIRAYEVGIANYRGAPAEDCPYLLDRLCTWLNGSAFDPDPSQPELRLGAAALKAILAHLYLVWIHPFGDGNGRTARLLEFLILVAAGLPTPAAHLLSNHYNRTRTEYYRQLHTASASGGDVMSFAEYALQGLADGLREQIELVHYQQLELTWRNYVHEMFATRKPSEANRRRRMLVLDMSSLMVPTAKADLPMITPRVARAYANKTTKTLSRDLNTLDKMGLIKRHPDGWMPNISLILGFLPTGIQAREVEEEAATGKMRRRGSEDSQLDLLGVA